VKGPLAFSAADHLGELRLGAGAQRSATATPPAELGPVGVEIRLVPTLAPPRRVVGALVAWDEAPRLKKLIYALPPVLLRGRPVAVPEPGFLLLAREGVDVVPLGTLLSELAPGLLVPIGMDLIPRVPTEVLATAIEHELAAAGKREEAGKRLTVFAHG